MINYKQIFDVIIPCENNRMLYLIVIVNLSIQNAAIDPAIEKGHEGVRSLIIFCFVTYCSVPISLTAHERHLSAALCTISNSSLVEDIRTASVFSFMHYQLGDW